jgi:hypothetical protein
LTFYVIWVVYMVCLTSLYAIVSVRSQGCEVWWPTIILWGLGCIGIWPLVARYSTNLLFDGLLYDIIMVTTFFGVCLVMLDERLQSQQWVGFFMALLGLILMKVKL